MILIIDLSKEQAADALAMARQRNTGKPQDTHFDGGHDPLEIHYMSALAEVAWEYLTGWPADRQHRPAGDAGVDFENNSRTYQIKARDAAGYKEPDLLVRTSHAQADRFVLAEVNTEKPQVSFIGWCTRDELIETVVDLPTKGKRYIRHRSKLRTIPPDIINI